MTVPVACASVDSGADAPSTPSSRGASLSGGLLRPIVVNALKEDSADGRVPEVYETPG
jgi:hypothetical protein